MDIRSCRFVVVCVCVCVCVYIYIYMCVCVYIYIYMLTVHNPESAWKILRTRLKFKKMVFLETRHSATLGSSMMRKTYEDSKVKGKVPRCTRVL